MIGQIHDSQIYDMHPDDKPLLFQLYKEALADLRIVWKWLIVPIVVETEFTPVDKPWNELEGDEMIISEWEPGGNPL